MVEKLSWIPESVNVELPSSARVYDYLLGGAHNFEMDRAAAETLLKVVPARDMARLNRDFLRRAVSFMLDSGITQFLDLGSGIPTVGNVHEVAQAANPNAQVVYVDIEPVAAAHAGLLLEGNDNAAMIHGDLCDLDGVLNAPVTQRLIDFAKPVGLLMVGVMQFIPDSRDPWSVTRRYRDVLAPGSYLAMSHFTPDGMPEAMARAVEVFARTQEPAFPRTAEQILRMFEGFELVEPGLVYTGQWRPETSVRTEHPEQSNLYAAVARKV